MKSFVITGAGSGIGRAAAQLLAQSDDVKLLLIGRNKLNLETTRNSLANADNHIAGDFDIREKKSWEDFYRSINAHELNICGLFANAGIGGENHYGNADRWSEVISTNLDGTYITIMETLPYLKKSTDEYKHIVITSSCLARFGVSNYTAYCTAKTGLLGLNRSLALQFAPDKILVNAICPGWVETDMAKAGIQKLADSNGITYTESFNQQMSYVPLNKISKPSEIAELVKFLFSNKQTSVTGQALDINNGSYMN